MMRDFSIKKSMSFFRSIHSLRTCRIYVVFGVLTNLSRTEFQVAELLSLSCLFPARFQGPPGCINYFDIHVAPCVGRVCRNPPQLIKNAPLVFGSNMITKHQQLHSTLKKFKKSCKNKICALSNCKVTLSQRIKSVGFKNFALQLRAIHSIRKYSKLSMKNIQN